MANTSTVVRLPASERRQQLLETALHVFARQGYHETSMNDLAAKAGVTKPVLYQHFESKREMYLAVIQETSAAIRDAIDSEQSVNSDSPQQIVESGILGFFQFFERTPDAFDFLYGVSLELDAELRHEARKVQEEFMIKMVKRWQSEDLEKALVVAAGIHGLLLGMIRHWMQDGQRHSAQEMTDLASNLILNGAATTTEKYL